MTPHTLTTSLNIAAAGTAGLLFGSVYFAMLGWTVRLYRAHSSSVAPAALTVGRIAAAALAFAGAARLGALPLLASFAGFLLARACAVHAVRKGT